MIHNNGKDGLQAKLKSIKLDLGAYKVLLHFKNRKDPFVIHFDSPARRFYLSLIALVVTEMKNQNKPAFIYIRKYEKTLKLLDNSLAGPNASKSVKGMWDKIRKAWRHRLPDLETAALFKILDRDFISPYEKGGKYRYDCSDDECDIWANLFGYDENNPWRFKFSIDSVSLGLNDVFITLGDLRDHSAWQEFVKRLSIPPKTVSRIERVAPPWWKKVVFSLIAVSIVVAATSVIWNFYLQPAPSVEVASVEKMAFPLPDKPSIAVLPFDNLSRDSSQDYFSDGITESIITALSNVSNLFVIARNSTFTYKGKPVKVQQVAHELGVRYVLEGSVQRSGDRVRITAQLNDALKGHHLWAEHYDRKISDIFALQDDITERVTMALEVKLTEGRAGPHSAQVHGQS
jgi:adenylate cyclase